MTRALYSLAVWLLLPWAALHLLWRARRQPDYLRHWGERFGLFGKAERTPAPAIWIHAVSVGETRAAQPLVAALAERFPGHRLLLTHMTPTGRATSTALFGDRVARSYLPYDTPGAMRRFLRRYRPALGIVMETELWPNLVAACRAQGVPLLLVNARLSERSAGRYARFPRLVRDALAGLSAVAAVSADDARRLAALGARDVQVFGNLKFDSEPPPAQLELGAQLRTRAGGRPLFLCASTREGEEALILDAWRHAAPAGALLAIVPRHPQRFDEVAQLAAARGFAVQRRSDGLPVAAATQVWLGDSMGEMFAWYAAASFDGVAFIGGSLRDFGSQNLIEACAVGAPVLLGPSTYNFAAAAADALADGAARQVRDANELVAAALQLLGDAARRRTMGELGRAFAARQRGATQRTLDLIARFMPSA